MRKFPQWLGVKPRPSGRWGGGRFPTVFICIPLPPQFSSLLLDATTAEGALQSTTGDRELGCAEK